MCLDKVNKNNLHIGCWNINGHKHKGFDKYSDQRFINEIKEKDIICFMETHCSLGVKPLIHQSELGTYMKVVPFQEKSSFHFVVL
jgi:exonuclease III